MDKDRTLDAPALARSQTAESCAAETIPETPAKRTEDCFRSCAGEVCSALYRLYGLSRTDAEDATQEAFLKLHAALVEGQDIENVRAWVHKAARNIVLNQIKARGKRRSGRFEQELGRALLRLASLVPVTPDRIYADRARRLALMRALRALPEEERRLLSERAAGSTLQEMATRHHMPDFHRVAGVLARIVRKLQRRIDV